jgi:TRAP-type C4-dicarboxylate transport system substrate-binding protein
MPAEYQELMNECFEEASKFGAENAKIVEDENKQKIIEAGVEIIELDQATYDAMFEKSLSVQDMIREAVGDELVDDYLSAIEAAK